MREAHAHMLTWFHIVYGSEAEKAGVKKARDMWIAARKRLGQSTEEKTEYIDDPEEARKVRSETIPITYLHFSPS